MGNLIFRGASRLDAFSVYPFQTWLLCYALGSTTDTPAVRPSRSSRTCLLYTSLSFLEISQPDFRALRIQQSGNRKIQFLAHLAHPFQLSQLFFMISVGKIKTSHIHSSQHQFSQLVFTLGCRSDCAYDFCISHLPLLLPPLRRHYFANAILISSGRSASFPVLSIPCTFSPCLAYPSINLMTSSDRISPGITKGIPGG